MVFALFLILSILAGLVGSIFSQVSGLLMSLALPLSLISWEASVAWVIGYRSVTSITQYLNNLGQSEVGRKSLTDKGKQLSVSYGAANIYWQVKLLVTIVTCMFSLIIPWGDLIPSAGIILPLSVACTGLGWTIYIIRKGKRAPYYIGIVLLLGALAIFTTKTGMIQGTAVLMFSLYSMKGILHQTRGSIPTQKDGFMPCKETNFSLGILNGILSSTAIGFTSIKMHTSKNEVRDTYTGAISDGIADTLGLLLFFLQGSSRDMTTTFLGLALNNVGTLPLGVFVIVALISLAINMFTLGVLSQIAEYKIHLHNVCAGVPFSHLLGVVINIGGLAMISGSFWGVVAILSVGFIINTLMKEWRIHPEFSGVLLCLLPALALFGAV